jgi:hypothetical protein
MFIQVPTIVPASVVRYDYLQSAEATGPLGMEQLFAQYLTDLIAENVGRQTPLNVLDMDIAGGGDGHTFVVRILVSSTAPTVTNTGWLAAELVDVRGRFWLGANAEALEAYQEAAIAALRGSDDIVGVAVGLAGATKGTRFMAFMAARVPIS